MRVVLPLIVAVVVLSPAWATNPGEPLDCSDWVFLEPGLSCSVFVPAPIPDGLLNDGLWLRGNEIAVDNQGRMLIVSDLNVPTAADHIEIIRFSGEAGETLAVIENRVWYPVPGDNPRSDRIALNDRELLTFDPSLGRLFVPLRSYCSGFECPAEYGGGNWIAVIKGFTTTFEVLQSYEPASNTFGYRVPYMPEGFQYTDYFDTYYGSLTNPIDFSKAQPLECGYPATAPSVGDYLTVADPLPDPPVNTGRYYITAASYMGQRRYGRKNNGGVLSGRNPANLPPCEQTEEQP